MKFFRNMDEMELHLSLNAIRVAWFFTVIALFIWGIWDCVHTGRITRSGQSIVCLPEQVVIQLTGGTSDADVVLG